MMIRDNYRSGDCKWGLFGFFLLLYIFLGFILAMPAEALRLKTNWARRVDLSEKIVRGQVIDVRSYWDYKKNLIYTDVTILVDEHIKGNGSRKITITIPGGTVCDQTHLVSDTPQFAIGDYGVISLEPSGHVTAGPDGVHFLQKPMPGTNQLQSLAEDRFLSWIKAYINGQTRVSFEELPEEPSGVLMQQGISNAAISGVSPSTISAGTGDVLTISGSGFGASRGSGDYPTIAFRYKGSNYMYDNSAIKTWSDTQIQVEVWTGVINSYHHSPGSWNNPNGTVAFINSSGSIESSWSLAVPFGYGSAKWLSSIVPYYINATGGPSGSLSAIQNAANTWSGAGAGFTFNYGGATTQGLGYDGYNVLSFADLGSSTIIAQATTYFSGGIVSEADIQFNTGFPFSTNPTPPSDKMDLQSIAVHELGHWLRLLDLYGANDTNKVMYGFSSFGQIKRNLTLDDQSGIQWIYGLLDITPPTPNPMTWAIPPYAASGTSISMAATTATDPKLPINYFFNFVNSPTVGVGGSNSSWQTGTTYVNTGLQANHQYGYRVKAIDGSNNETAYSTPTRYAYTAIEDPSGIGFASVTSTSIQVQSINTPSGLTRRNSGLLVENTTKGTNSGWKQNNNFWTSSSLSPNTSYSFRAKARNGDAIETSYSPPASKYTLANPPSVASFSNVTESCIRPNWTANANPVWTEYFCENTTTMTNSGWITNVNWDSCGLVCGSSYSFRVKARNKDGVETGWTSLGSQSTSACPIPLPPTNVQATDGTYTNKVQVTWTASAMATSYTVYRGTYPYTFYAASLGTTSGMVYDDTTATPGVVYYYWVKASNTFGASDFSAYNAGSRSNGIPLPPTNVQATDGTYTDKVQVTWTASAMATSYTVYRGTYPYTFYAASLGTTSGMVYDDTTATPGVVYYYWVKASNTFGASDFSAYNAGSRSNGIPLPPTNVQATDGTYTDKVQVTWTASAMATSYTVYRGTYPYTFYAASLGTTSGMVYDDTTATPGVVYYYWVKASNTFGASDFSAYNAGSRSNGIPLPPTNVQATDGTYTDKVQVTWTASAMATSYTVYRGTYPYTFYAASLGTTSGMVYDDTTATPGVVYYYWVKASNTFGASGFSAYNAGSRP